MVIDDFYVVRVALRPSETNSPLIIDSDTVLSRAVTTKFLEPVARGNSQVIKRVRAVEDYELLEHGTM